MYLSDRHSKIEHPVKELKGFAKTHLEPGSSRTVELVLDSRALSHWDTETHSWKMTPGEFAVLIGASSEQIELQKAVQVD